jgi:hypothetical protein
VEAGEGTVEFRPSGPVAFRLVGKPACPILGFAQPRPAATRSESSLPPGHPA